MSKHATRGLDADGNQIYADDGEKATEFSLLQWAKDEAETFVESNPIEFYLTKGFHKALELVMEEFEKWAKEDEDDWQSKDDYATGYISALDGSKDSLKQIINGFRAGFIKSCARTR